MFNDFHESIRGVGVVGMLLGLLVLAGFCGLGMAVLSGQGDRGPTIGMRLADQERRMMFVSGSLKGSKAELADARRAQEMLTINTGKFTLVSEKLAVEEKLMGEAEVIATSLKEDLDGIQLDFEEYRDQYRVNERGLAVGETLDFSETKGDAFKSCKVSKITPLNVHVMRSTGPIGIPYKELPSEIQDRFQFGEEEAQIYQNKLDASNAINNRRIAKWQEKQNQLKGEAARESLIEKIAQVQKDILTKTNFAAEQDTKAAEFESKAVTLERKAASAKVAGRISSNTGHARQARNRAGQHARHAADARKAIVQLTKDQAEYERLLAKMTK